MKKTTQFPATAIKVVYKGFKMKKLMILPIVIFSFQAANANSIDGLTNKPAKLVINKSSAFAIDITGKVVDERGETLIGVTITEKGTNNNAVTKIDGTFSIRVADENAILQFSYIGYNSVEIPVKNSKNLNIVLQPSTATSLNEVVVIGYGTAKKADLTGAVSSVNLDALRNQPNTNIGQYLQGTVPGLNVGIGTSAGATPPINIRGQVTLNGSQTVLIILDGVQYTQSLSSINPNDIADISVLKDASSTAVYGAQAANGVILITSRRGKLGRPRISFNTDVTTQSPTVGFRPNDRAGYLEGIRQAYYDQAYLAPTYTVPNPAFNIADRVDASNRTTTSSGSQLLPNDFDWWKAATNKGLISETNLSISGANDRVNYLLSGGYTYQRNMIINDLFKRKSLRANIEVAALPWWKVGLQASGSFVNQDGAEPALGSIQRFSPLLVPYDAQGKLITNPTNTLETNPFTTYDIQDYDRNEYLTANITSDMDLPFLKGLHYRFVMGNNYTTSESAQASIYGANLTGSAFKQNIARYEISLDNILTYKRDFGKHAIETTLLYGSRQYKDNTTRANATGFSRLTLGYNNLGLGTTQTVTSGANQNQQNRQMARIFYRYNNRYLFTATATRDGFSGFSENYKYAIFPSFSAGWVFSEEQFWKDNFGKTFEYMKLRVGYGHSGNQTGAYSTINRIGQSAAYIFGDGGTTAFGQQVTQLGNNNLKWERTKEVNIGLDFAILKNRLSGTLEYYNKNTFDLLYDVNIPNITGFTSIRSNLGQINNYGFEAQLTGRVIEGSKFSWTSTANFSLNRNKIVRLLGIDANGDGREDDLINNGRFIGKPIGQIYDYKNIGIYQIGEPRLPGFPVGSIKIEDTNKDGKIDPNDRQFLGMLDPRFRASLLNNFSYKNFTLTVFINSVWGSANSYIDQNNVSYYREDNSIRDNQFYGVDYWSPTNPDGKYPRNISGTRAGTEPNMYQDRSFVRIQDVSLGYNFAGSFLRKIGAQSISLYVSGKNLYTFTKWEGFDPEPVFATGNRAGRASSGLEAGVRPVMRGVTMGLNVTF